LGEANQVGKGQLLPLLFSPMRIVIGAIRTGPTDAKHLKLAIETFICIAVQTSWSTITLTAHASGDIA
jgi:hypothetical protein